MFKTGPVTTTPQEGKGLIHEGERFPTCGTPTLPASGSVLTDLGLWPLLRLARSEESFPPPRRRCEVRNSLLLLSASGGTHWEMSLVAGAPALGNCSRDGAREEGGNRHSCRGMGRRAGWLGLCSALLEGSSGLGTSARYPTVKARRCRGPGRRRPGIGEDTAGPAQPGTDALKCRELQSLLWGLQKQLL